MEDERPRGCSALATEAPLPPERAFVVQLRPPRDPGGELFVGRVEHIASGTVFRFGSAAELTGFIARIVDARSGPATGAEAAAASGRENDRDTRHS